MKTKFKLPRRKKKDFTKWVITNWRKPRAGGFKFSVNPFSNPSPEMVLEDLFVFYRTIKFNQGKTTFTTKGL